LQRAAEIIGDEVALAFKLRVTPSHLALWINGLERPPDDAFLKAVDIVLDHQRANAGAPKRPASPSPRH